MPVDDRAVRPRARGRDVEVVAPGLGLVAGAAVGGDEVAEARVPAPERAVVALFGGERLAGVGGCHTQVNGIRAPAIPPASGARPRSRVTSAPGWRPKQREDDAALLAALRAGDERAFERLVDRHHAALVRVARQYVPTQEIAEDVAQEAWLGLLRGLDSFEGRSSLRTYLFRIVMNLARTRGVREARSAPFSSLVRDDEDGPSVEPERFIAAPERAPATGPRRSARGAAAPSRSRSRPRRSRRSTRRSSSCPRRSAASSRCATSRASARTRCAICSGSPRATSACCCTARARSCGRHSRSTTHERRILEDFEPGELTCQELAELVTRLPRGRARAARAREFAAHIAGCRDCTRTSSRCARRSRSRARSARRGHPARGARQLLDRVPRLGGVGER